MCAVDILTNIEFGILPLYAMGNHCQPTLLCLVPILALNTFSLQNSIQITIVHQPKRVHQLTASHLQLQL